MTTPNEQRRQFFIDALTREHEHRVGTPPGPAMRELFVDLADRQLALETDMESRLRDLFPPIKLEPADLERLFGPYPAPRRESVWLLYRHSQHSGVSVDTVIGEPARDQCYSIEEEEVDPND